MKRQSRNLSSSLEHRLSRYALAASAAGVSLLALAQSSEAKIVYTKSYAYIHDGYVKVDLNHDGTTDLEFFQNCTEHRFPPSYSCLLAADPASGGGIAGEHKNFAAALESGRKIGSSYGFRGGVMAHVRTIARRYYKSGSWFDSGSLYIGVKFVIKSETHFGWVRIEDSSQHSATLTGYAYETIPNKPIIAGKTHGKDVITVEPASLGHLARGAAAIPAWRVKETR